MCVVVVVVVACGVLWFFETDEFQFGRCSLCSCKIFPFDLHGVFAFWFTTESYSECSTLTVLGVGNAPFR